MNYTTNILNTFGVSLLIEKAGYKGQFFIGYTMLFIHV